MLRHLECLVFGFSLSKIEVSFTLRNMTDKQLYALCKKWGAEALEARRKFAGLLPEVFRRRLFERRGFCSIYEFAAKLAGMSRDQVDMVLRLDRKFEDKPILREALVKGEVSPHKLIRVASIANAENQQKLFEKTRQLSKQAIDVFVKDYKNKNGLRKPVNEDNSLPGQRIELSEKVNEKLLKLKEKGIDVDALLLELLEEREKLIQEEKEELAQEQQQKQENRAVIGFPASRYIPAKIKRIVYAQHGTKCSVEGCTKRSEHLHHVNPFLKSQNHDPNNLRPLCRGHHELMHSGFK